jgi:hypothetical protein
VLQLSAASHPAGWRLDSAGELVPAGAGTVTALVPVPTAGRYGIWLGGSFRDRLEVDVDGRRVATLRNQLNYGGQYTELAEVTLRPGAHDVALRYGGPDLHPGSGGVQFGMGPLVLSRTTAEVPVTYVPAANARSLCGHSLDWVEALPG